MKKCAVCASSFFHRLKFAKFHTRLGMVYSLLSTLLVLILGLVFYFYNARTYEKNACLNNMELAHTISGQLENHVQYMDFISLDCISQTDFTSALKVLSITDRNKPENVVVLNNAATTINNRIIRASILKSVSRLSVFNRNGDFFTTHIDANTRSPDIPGKIEALPWLEDARGASGNKILVPPYPDPWEDVFQREVFSLARMVRDPGKEIAFIEVQSDTEVLAQLCGLQSNTGVLLYSGTTPVYSSFELEKTLFDHYLRITGDNAGRVFIADNSTTKQKEIVSCVCSDYLGWNIVVIQEIAAVFRPLAFVGRLTMLIAAILATLSMTLSYTIAKRLTKPVRELRDCMEEINISNLPVKKEYSYTGIEEVESLTRSFQVMRNRLNRSMQQEIEMRSLIMKARFDSLQAQINPHFIYNMLNVIANMGLEANSYAIADTCRKISSMLRFSTSNIDKRTTLEEEIAHVSNYLSLMKLRFEHKLEYALDVNPAILNAEIPKLILQPLVENSIYHGFKTCKGTMKISISGSLTESAWRIDITDNGSGFAGDTLKAINEKIGKYEREIKSCRFSDGFSIGGLGIINTFIRLTLFYDKKVSFQLGNNPGGGAFISFAVGL